MRLFAYYFAYLCENISSYVPKGLMKHVLICSIT